ncbi:MAG TPA: trehalase family glycosidase [Candidatus Limnocylindrales bacterium]|nr:trehalase family glycosidase [Candidatus Limnocylindrales bacterium]
MLTRREFNSRALAAALSLPLSTALKFAPEAYLSTSTATAINPFDDAANFTPYGYLDNPYHCWNLHRSGILRSLPGIGFGIYFPAGPGGYFDERKNGIYHASLRLGFLIGSRRLWNPQDFSEAELTASHHSKNVLTYRIRAERLDARCSFFQVGEDVIAARFHFDSFPAGLSSLRVIAAHEYQLGNAEWWGGDGVTGAYEPSIDGWLTRSFAAGPVFAVVADIPSREHASMNAQSWGDASIASAAPPPIVYATEPLRVALAYDITPAVAARDVSIYMARGANHASALAHLSQAKKSSMATLASHLDEDSKFWAGAPRLTGDWPRHWLNGWVYDFETLRMIVRRPIGTYAHPWDAMQIQAPRNVLAETSIDMFALSYADPATAKAVFLGQFLDALAPNVPCAREDGEMNMVAADGSECGTSLSWCYPFHCARSIYQRTHDREWLAALYPRLAALAHWTLEHRADKEGFLFAKCSWESGMDASRRFLIKEPTGAELTEFIRLVELQSAMAQAGSVMAEFAAALGNAADQKHWMQLHDTYAAKTQQLWNGRDWFTDFDTRTMRPITSVARDAGQVGPIFCGVTKPEQAAAMMPTLRAFYESSRDGTAGEEDPFFWSSLMLPYLESLWTAREFELLANVVHLVADRIYTSMDRRTVSDTEDHRRLGWPGVSCEQWGTNGAKSGEGYGWGAVMPAHIIRNILGVRETTDPNQLLFSPNLPSQFITAGRAYALENLPLCSRRFSIRLAVKEENEIEISGKWPAGEILVEDAADGSQIARGRDAFSFRGRNRRLYRLTARQAQHSK